MAVISNTKPVNSRLEAVRVFFGKGECRTIQFVADSSGSLNDETIELGLIRPSTSLAEVEDYKLIVHYDVAGGGTPPTAAAGEEVVSVAIATDATAGEVRDATKAALDALGYFYSKNTAADVTAYENGYPGAPTNSDDALTSGFTITQAQAGSGGDLGPTAEGVDLSFEVSKVAIQANQFGGLILGERLQGVSGSVSASFLELTRDRLEQLIGGGTGDTKAASGSPVTGFGQSKLFKDLADYNGRLILHPIRLAASDRTDDWVLWRTSPSPASINFDGTAQQALEIEFIPYLSSGISTEVNLVSSGDWLQNDLVV